MNLDRFLVFVRADRHPWVPLTEHFATEQAAREMADAVVEAEAWDRAVVMEVGSTDAMPMFTWKYRAPRKKA